MLKEGKLYPSINIRAFQFLPLMLERCTNMIYITIAELDDLTSSDSASRSYTIDVISKACGSLGIPDITKIVFDGTSERYVERTLFNYEWRDFIRSDKCRELFDMCINYTPEY
jgi:hypothetical protein